MLHGTVKNTDLKSYMGPKLSAIKVGEFILSFYFGHDKQLDITTYWEFFDESNPLPIDRAIALKQREQFHLLKLIGTKLISSSKLMHQVELVFEGNYRIVVS